MPAVSSRSKSSTDLIRLVSRLLAGFGADCMEPRQECKTLICSTETMASSIGSLQSIRLSVPSLKISAVKEGWKEVTAGRFDLRRKIVLGWFSYG